MAQSTKIVLGVDTREFKRGIQQADRSLGKMQKSVAGVGLAIAGAFATTAIAAFIKEAARLGAEMQGVRQSFEYIAEPDLLENLRTAVKGTVSDLELMKSANQAIALGLKQANLPEYFEFARRRAKATGEEVDYLVDSIVRGIGTQSKKVIDNLGISQKALTDEIARGYTFAEATANLMRQQMGTMPNDIQTLAEKWAAVNIELKNSTTTFGESMLPVLTRSVQSLTVFMRTIDLLVKKWADFNFMESFLFGQQISDISPVVEQAERALADAVADLLAPLPDFSAQSGAAAGSVGGTGGELDDVTDKINKGKTATEKWNEAIRTQIGLVGLLQTNYSDFTGTVKDNSVSMEDNFELIITFTDHLNNALMQSKSIIMRVGQLFQESFTAALISGESFVDTLTSGIKELITQLLIAAGVATLLATLTGGASTGGGLFGGGKGFGGAFKNIFGMLTGVQFMAEGGIVTSATPAIIGEAGAEAVIPLNKLHDFMGGGDLVTRISGRDLEIILRRQNQSSKASYGYTA